MSDSSEIEATLLPNAVDDTVYLVQEHTTFITLVATDSPMRAHIAELACDNCISLLIFICTTLFGFAACHLCHRRSRTVQEPAIIVAEEYSEAVGTKV